MRHTSLIRIARRIAILTSVILWPHTVAAGPTDTSQPGYFSKVGPALNSNPRNPIAPKLTAGAITTVQLINTAASTQTNAVTTFGHAFKQGDVPAGFTVIAKDSSGNPVTLQVDKKATHADGSLRHAILTAKLATLGASATQAITLFAQADGAVQPAVSLASLLATAFDSQVSLNVGGTVYSASARTLLQTPTPKSWLAGPAVSEWIVGGPVKDVSGNPHPHLAAYFHIRAYAGSPITKVRVDAVVENNWTLVPSPSDFTYVPNVTIGGATIYNNGGANLVHYSHARWHQTGWWNNTDSKVYPKLDTTYLQDTKMIPKYGATTVTDTFLSSARQSTAPMTNGDQTAYMDGTGAQDGIALLPRWDAVYAVSGDQRAFNYSKANSDGGAAYSIHYRDENTGLPMTIDSYPNSDFSGWSYANPFIQRGTASNPYSESGASTHQPSIGYLPYLVTGDYYYLEEMEFWAVYSLGWTPSYARGGDYGFGGNGSTGIFYTQPLRGRSWAYRSVGQAAAITPDAHPLKSYFTNKLLNNLAYDVHAYISPGASPNASIFGTMRNSDLNTEYRTWQDDFFTAVMGMLVDFGFTQAVPVFNYKIQNTLGRMGEDATKAYCFQFGPGYVLTMGPTDTTLYSTWAEVYDAQLRSLAKTPTQTPVTGACGSLEMAAWMTATLGSTYVQNQETGYSQAYDGYYSSMQPALAAAVSAGRVGAASAWAKSQSSSVKPDYTNFPQWNIIPRSASTTQPPSTVTLSANPNPVTNGSASTLTWSSTNASTCAASGAWSGVKATSGSQVISNITQAATYTLTCGSATQGVNISLQ